MAIMMYADQNEQDKESQQRDTLRWARLGFPVIFAVMFLLIWWM